MNRRELLKLIAVATGASLVGGEFLLTGCKTGDTGIFELTSRDIALLDEIGETIIPATTTPGAKAARIGEFMKVMVADCYRKDEQATFKEGLSRLQERCNEEYKQSFMKCTPEERRNLLLQLEKEAIAYNKKRDLDDKIRKEEHDKGNNGLPWKERVEFVPAPVHYYTMMKQLTLWGFFTSKTGMTETLRHIPVPGKYDGEYPYTKGDKAWAE